MCADVGWDDDGDWGEGVAWNAADDAGDGAGRGRGRGQPAASRRGWTRRRGMSRRGRHLLHQRPDAALEYGYSSLHGVDFPPLGSGIGDLTVPQGNRDNAESGASFEEDVRAFFLKKMKFPGVARVRFSEHFDAQVKNRTRYAAGILVLHNSGVTLSQNVYVRALAAAWARHDHALAESLLGNAQHYGIAEVMKAVTLLDAGRRVRTQEKKLKRLQMSHRGRGTGIRANMKYRFRLASLKNVKPKAGSASGALCRHVQRWVRRIKAEDLEFYALHLPTQPWKMLADVCHLHPEKDFAGLPWFLPYCFGGPAPEDSIVHHCRHVKPENVNELVMKWPVPYSHIKKWKHSLTVEAKTRIATYTTKLDTLLWHYEDLQCEEVNKVIQERLKSGEAVALPTGKLMERLLMMKMLKEVAMDTESEQEDVPFYEHLISIADRRLSAMSLPLESPIVVMGDRSASMEVAIHTSTIIASLLAAVTSAKLVFFNNNNTDAPFLPQSVKQALELAVLIGSGGGTAPAASLYPFYQRKEVIKMFIIVTDEMENDSFKGFFFDELFAKYHNEVHPAQLVFVSFLRRQSDYGQMMLAVEDRGLKPIQFKLDRTRPDLSKLDKLFGVLSSGSGCFEEQLASMEREIRDEGLRKVFSRYYGSGQ